MEISDNGCGMTEAKIDADLQRQVERQRGSEGIGIFNVHERIRLRYGPPFGVTMTPRPQGGTLVRISFPALGEGVMGYTISIVDDEPRVRKGLQSSSAREERPGRSAGSSPAGTRAGGRPRGAQLTSSWRTSACRASTVCELAYALRTASPDTVVVVMSGYKEFDYARRAMKVGVLDFIVKPIEEEELFAVLDRARAEVERRKSTAEGRVCR